MKIPKKRFRFIRHAETDWNEKRLCQGIRDIPLNASGKAQAAAFGRKSVSLSIETLCSSPLLRATETATAILAFHPYAKLQIVDGLKERDWGDLEGISSEHMYAVEKQEEKDPFFDPGSRVESRENFKARVLVAMHTSLQYGDNPLLVSHGRVFLILCELLKIPLIRQLPHLTVVEFSPTFLGWQCNIVTLQTPHGQECE